MRKSLMISVSGMCLLLLAVCTATVYGVGPYSNNGTTVVDNGTGLEWQQSDDGQTRTWEEALAYCEGLPLAGHSDWRLPNFRELDSIVDLTRYDPAINTDYFSCQSSSYWSATTDAINTSNAWGIYFINGGDSRFNKANSRYVRCVRAGLSGSFGQFVNLSVGTILIPSTREDHDFGLLLPLEEGTTIDNTQETFVIVHGWNPDGYSEIPPNPSYWVRKMGNALKAYGNVLLWDWMEQAVNNHDGGNIVQKVLGVPYSMVEKSGESLAISLNNYLGNYNGKIHLIGHSLGSGVVLFAAKRFKEVYHRSNIKQLTLLDSPWIAHYPAGDFLKKYKDELFVDNYHTMFGRPQGYHYADVNVDIGDVKPINKITDFLSLSFRHQYAHIWYLSSIVTTHPYQRKFGPRRPFEWQPVGYNLYLTWSVGSWRCDSKLRHTSLF